MNFDRNGCNTNWIESYLEGDLEASAEESLLQHLDECQACRDFMEQKAGQADDWEEATLLLRPGEYDSAGSPEYSTASFTSFANRESAASSENMLQMLGQSEAPNSLGRLAEYEILSVIGVGGMGVVIEGFDATLDRSVAIKVLAPHLAKNDSARRRFAREARAVAAIQHPNVVAIHSVSSHNGLPYLVMPFVRDGSLQDLLKEKGTLPVDDVLSIARQIAAGLAAAHESGLVHRDIKPANVLMDSKNNEFKLTDFGLARAVDDVSITRLGSIAGTPEYMSPEQATGKEVKQSSDLFSLGSIAYAMCTGRPPFSASNSLGMMRCISDETPTPIEELNPEVPGWLCGIVEKLMSKSPNQRFESAASVAEILKDCIAHREQPDSVPLPNVVKESDSNKRTEKYSGKQPSTSSWTVGRVATASFLALTAVGLLFLASQTWFGSANMPSPAAPDETANSNTDSTNTDSSSQSDKTTHAENKTDPIATLKVGDPAPDISVDEWLIGEHKSDGDSNKAQIVSFWSSQSLRSFYSMRHWGRLQTAFPEFEFIVVCTDQKNETETMDMVEAIQGKLGKLSCPIANDFDHKISETWLDAALQTETPCSFVCDQSGRLAWVGVPEQLESILTKLKSGSFDIETAIEINTAEKRTRSRFTAAMEKRDWDQAVEQLPKARLISPVAAGQLDWIRFKLRLNDEDKTAAFRMAQKMRNDYPGLPELLCDLAEKLTVESFEVTFETGETPADWIMTAKTLAAESVMLTLRRDSQCLATLARVYDCQGDIETAIAIQEEAVSQSKKSTRTKMQDILNEYQQTLAARG